ncbi:2-oxo-4-hydroxy-4-carboxy-5-ureidoimidazoline decarboxylase [Streptomyces sp. NPDC050161]|uniref:2-oxo-4-hydroxy-4-carboxy-5-ureidoimidazoline decarboxylase n=1 Tax=Streptomyces sp. NPDC050161 TaxID=3365604 RepID=UPI00379581FF
MSHTPRRGIPSQTPGPPLPLSDTGEPAAFNALPPDAATAALPACCGSRRWVARIAAHRPYPDLGALLAASDEACYDLTPADLDEALAAESAAPLPLPVATGPGTLAAHTALRAAHAEYERRFRHAFVICLDGYRDDEQLDQMLAGIRTRLGNDPDEERAVTADEMRRLVRGRLARLAAECP